MFGEQSSRRGRPSPRAALYGAASSSQSPIFVGPLAKGLEGEGKRAQRAFHFLGLWQKIP